LLKTKRHKQASTPGERKNHLEKAKGERSTKKKPGYNKTKLTNLEKYQQDTPTHTQDIL
jgi:hypothetical protein